MITVSEADIAAFKLWCDGVDTKSEGGLTYIFLARLKVPEGCTPSRPDALFCPEGRDGYQSRLYFSERLSGPNVNWTPEVRILERNWSAFSWQPNEPGLPLPILLSRLLDPLR